MAPEPDTFALIITGGSRISELNRFFQSLALQGVESTIEVIFVNQGRGGILDVSSIPIGVKIETIEVGGPLSLSRARNMALKRLGKAGIVGFPDDDCWYPQGLLREITNLFRATATLDCVCTQVIDPQRNKAYGNRPFGVVEPIRARNIFRLPISVGMFVRRSALESVERRFDESIGAGTKWGSGEETEFIARLLEKKRKVLYYGNLSVYHPVPTTSDWGIAKYRSYGLGFGYVSGMLIMRGHYSVCLYCLEILIRSLAGYLLAGFSHDRRNGYRIRLLAILEGLFAARRAE